MSDLFDEPADATPLTSEEQAGLLPTWVTNRQDLNEVEQDNIVKGGAWARRRRLTSVQLMTDEFSRLLHKRMFGDVWMWAGQYRTTARNIGIGAWRIPTELANMFDDVRYWIEHQTYPADELAIRLHHRLVSIHPFPNGNGRHARMMADLLIEKLGRTAFSWGGGGLGDTGQLRKTYIAALQAADTEDIAALLVFARS